MEEKSLILLIIMSKFKKVKSWILKLPKLHYQYRMYNRKKNLKRK